MEDDLPADYDVIVVGTGMPECMLAAAAARNGKRVLHLDRNGYYGSEWTSFNFDQLCDWISEQKTPQGTGSRNLYEEILLLEGERAISTPLQSKSIWNVCDISYIREDEASATNIPEHSNLTLENNPETVAGVEDPVLDATSTSNVTNPLSDSENQDQQSEENEESHHREQVSDSVPSTNESLPSEENEESHHWEQMSDSVPSTDEPSLSSMTEDCPSPAEHLKNAEQKKEWTLSKLKSMKRKFNLDLSPKLLFSRGPLVELLISSNIARYAEFKSVTRVLTFIDGHLEQVPCSRADVFSTKHVSVAEKRMLMKLLTFALEFQKHPNEYRGYEGLPFIDFLHSKKLTPNVKHYVIHAIAMVEETTPTLQALKATQKFLESLGRYGNSPFIWPLFGSAELPQCFCRLCAVYGGIYYLKRSVDHIIVDESGVCKGIISNGKRMNCSWLVMEPSYIPQEILPDASSGTRQNSVSRGIFITDSSLLSTEREQLTLLRLPFSGLDKTPVTVLELGPGSMVCPEGLFVVHMTMQSKGNTAKDDLWDAANLLFQPLDIDCAVLKEGKKATKPKVLWVVFFNQLGNPTEISQPNVSSVISTSFPDYHMDYEYTVNEVKKLFENMFPGEPFLPRAPDPEEIIIESGTENNPGEDSRGQASPDEEAEKNEPDGITSGDVAENSETELKELNADVSSTSVNAAEA